MAQFTASQACEIRVATSERGKYATFRLQAGETLVTDDPVTAQALADLSVGPRPADRAVATLAVRPASPTHDVDRKPRADLPAEAKPVGRVR